MEAKSLAIFLVLCAVLTAFAEEEPKPDRKDEVVKARLETCGG